MQRRTFITASAAALAAPSLARAQSASVFKWIPQADISSLDPVWTTAYVARTHGFLVFDTLYGQSGPHGGYTATPQMVEGHVIENDGKTWKLTLREGLLFHDGTKVLARDCVASIKRWAARDTLGLTLMSITNELTAPDDKTIVFRLKKPFPLLAEALGKTGSPCCVIMPERLANTDPFKQVTEMVGSGPYRFKPDERVQGAFFAYERFQNYLPRPTGETEWISGPKIAHFDRVEFHVIPDASTAAAAMKSGEMDGWEFPTGDLLPLLDRERHLKRELVYETGFAVFCRLNHRQPPFDNPAIRRALFAAIDQDAAIIAAMGDDPTLRKNPCGFFPPGSPMASDVGMQNILPRPDYDKAKTALKEAGYKGETIAFMVATDIPIFKAAGQIMADSMQRAGLNVAVQASDFGTIIQRRASKKPVSEGGWSAFCVMTSSGEFFTPATHNTLRGDGDTAWFGWPTSPRLESLRDTWLDAPDLATQKKLAAEIQAQAFIDVPYLPLGALYNPSIYRRDVTNIVHGFPVFWNMKRA